MRETDSRLPSGRAFATHSAPAPAATSSTRGGLAIVLTTRAVSGSNFEIVGCWLSTTHTAPSPTAMSPAPPGNRVNEASPSDPIWATPFSAGSVRAPPPATSAAVTTAASRTTPAARMT